MAETKTPGDKTLSVGSKTLSLKPRSETGIVRQSFSHGRTKQVVVEKKPKRRLPGEGGPVVETKPVAAAPAPRAAPARCADACALRQSRRRQRAAPACCCAR